MKFEIAGNQFVRDGQNIKIISGAVHYFRNMPDTWDDILDKLCAVGCNCVETYCPWNLHEKKQGEFDFSGMLDIKRFIKLAGEKGLMVIVRPGPYICAEWDFGGLPWWLLTQDDMEIRSSNKSFIKCCKNYLSRLFDEIRPLLSTNGGPIIMMQCENEYGYYGDDKKYLKILYNTYRELGIDVPLFTSDGTSKSCLLDGNIDECLATLNFGSRVDENFKTHDELFPNVPKMCMELWNGWFDAWGDDEHHTTSATEYAKVVDEMLARGSLNMYMFIGGTNFGFTSGANHDSSYRPQTTSYDYDALLTECGDITEKYRLVRNVIQKHIDYTLPEIPKNRKKHSYGKVQLTKFASLIDNLDNISKPVFSNIPKPMEEYGIGTGYIAYTTILNRDYENVPLKIEDVGDRADVYIDKTLVGIVYTNDDTNEICISAKAGDKLTILCENMGRANFGSKMMRKKGILGRCLIDHRVHFDWDVYPVPMDNLELLKFSENISAENSDFFGGYFEIDETFDTYLKLDNFKKGFVVINGFNIGRFWETGPQKTLYVPASILKPGKNEILVFDSDGIKGEPSVEFVEKSMTWDDNIMEMYNKSSSPLFAQGENERGVTQTGSF